MSTPSRAPAARLRIVISRVVACVFLIPALFTDSIWEVHPLIEGLTFLTGCVLVAFATIGRLWASLYICGYKTNRLITEGPYSLTRNPLYVLSLIGGIGVGLTTETLAIPLLIALAFAIYYPAVIRSEEAVLAQRHPEEFARYAAEVPRFWPRGFKHLVESPDYVVIPRAFRKAMDSAVWFVIFIGVLELAEALREGKIIPTLFHLW